MWWTKPTLIVAEESGVQVRMLSSAPHCARLTIDGWAAALWAVPLGVEVRFASAAELPGSTVMSVRSAGGADVGVSTRTWMPSAVADE